MRAGTAKVQLPVFHVLVQELRHEAGFSMSPHVHDCFSMLVPVAGAGTCKAAGKHYSLRANDVLLLPAGIAHSVADEPATPLVLFVIYLGGGMAQNCVRLLASPSASEVRHITISRQGSVGLRRLLRQVLHEQTNDLPGRELLIPAAIAEMLVLIRRSRQPRRSAPESSSGERIRQAEAHVAARLYEHWSLPQAAYLAGMSVRTFSQGFRRQFNASFVQHLNRLRVEKARSLLQRTDAQITAICFESGFEDLSHFYRVFRQVTGHAPGKERRSQAPGILRGTSADR